MRFPVGQNHIVNDTTSELTEPGYDIIGDTPQPYSTHDGNRYS